MRWVLVIMAVALSIALVVHAQTLIQPLPPGTYAVLMNPNLDSTSTTWYLCGADEREPRDPWLYRDHKC